jgi:hypothetical protein
MHGSLIYQGYGRSLEFSAGTSAWADIYRICESVYKQGQPNYVKTGIASQEEIEQIYDRMLAEMKENDFCGMYHFMSIIGTKL